MNIHKNYSATRKACYIGYVTQAIIINFVPLLFVMFNTHYNISLSGISLIIAVTFIVQLFVDLLSAKFIDCTGYRKFAITAHVFAAAGLMLLCVLPSVIPNTFIAILLACIVYSSGSGLIEVIISPIVESCPSDNDAADMSLLHSFYCWGAAFVIIATTVFFKLFGLESWKIITFIWSLIPIANIFLFLLVPIANENTKEQGTGIAGLCKSGIFWIFMLLMLCGGASELAMSQWASAFAETGLGVSKASGDIAGPFMFAIAMGTGRLLHAKLSDRVDITVYMSVCAAVCIIAYMVATLCPVSIIALSGCAVCGISAGVFWPGIFSLSAGTIKNGGTALFALLALGGDMGCTLGPAVVGIISEHFGNDLRKGLLVAVIFPTILLIGLLIHKNHKN